jgi:predicted cupin superfamily sugar epimerase
VISLLELRPHHLEGGHFRETWRGPGAMTAAGPRSAGTAIYYLVTPSSFSSLHRLGFAEIFHFYMGDPVEMLQLLPDGSGRVVVLGADVDAGMRPQVVVPAGVWQGSRLAGGGRFALLGTTMAPGFDAADYESGSREGLKREYPLFHGWIEDLTP